MGAMERRITPGNGSRLASCRLSAVLEMAFKSPVEGRAQACEQRNSSLDFSDGCRESNVGSATHSRRAAQAGLRSVGTNGFEMGSASPETCGPHEALADLPAEPSRGHCRHGFLHCADTDLRHSVLLFRDQP